MRRLMSVILLASLVSLPAIAQESQPDAQKELGFEEVVDNLDSSQNTDLHVKEYWKSVKGSEMVAKGTVLEVKPLGKLDQLRGRKGATVTLVNPSREAVKGVNIVLEITDVASAANLKRYDTLTFRGFLEGYRGGRDPGIRLELGNATILESVPGVAPPVKSAQEPPPRSPGPKRAGEEKSAPAPKSSPPPKREKESGKTAQADSGSAPTTRTYSASGKGIRSAIGDVLDNLGYVYTENGDSFRTDPKKAHEKGSKFVGVSYYAKLTVRVREGGKVSLNIKFDIHSNVVENEKDIDKPELEPPIRKQFFDALDARLGR